MTPKFITMDLNASKNTTQEDHDQLLSISETAKLLSVTPTTLRRWDKSGILKSIRLHERSRRFYRKGDVMVLILKESEIAEGKRKTPVKTEKIVLRDFGRDLDTSEDGKQAWLSFQSKLREMDHGANIEIDFSGLDGVWEGWAEEFLVPLHRIHGDKISMVNIENIAIITTLEVTGLYQRPYSAFDRL